MHCLTCYKFQFLYITTLSYNYSLSHYLFLLLLSLLIHIIIQQLRRRSRSQLEEDIAILSAANKSISVGTIDELNKESIASLIEKFMKAE